MKRGINSTQMQKNNRMLVFNTLLEEGSMTRTELASMLNLQKATITNIINEFYEIGIVEVDGDTAAGRRGEKICLKLEDIYLMSIGVTRKDYHFSIFSVYGKQVEHIQYCFKPNEDFSEIMEKIKTVAAKLQEKYTKKRIIGVCLAVPGLFINRPDKNVEFFMVSEFEELSHINIRKEIESALGREIFIKHDAKLSAYAEWRCAPEIAGIEKGSLAIVRSRGYGIGVGFIVNGAIMNGQLGLAGEVGYMGINFNRKHGPDDRSGTFEYCAGTESLVRYMLERLHEYPQTVLREESTYQEVLEAYLKGDPLAVWAVEKLAWMFGYGIANIIYTVNPDCIIIGPDYPNTGHFIDKVRESVRNCVPPYVEECAHIRYSNLEYDSFLLGGYYYMIERFEKEDILTRIMKARGEE